MRLTAVHVVYVGVHRLKWYPRTSVVRHDLYDIVDVSVTPPTLLEPKSQVRNHCWKADDLGILL